MSGDEIDMLLQGFVTLKRALQQQSVRLDSIEQRIQMFDGNPMCPLCRETFTTTEAFVNHYKRRHP